MEAAHEDMNNERTRHDETARLLEGSQTECARLQDLVVASRDVQRAAQTQLEQYVQQQSTLKHELDVSRSEASTLQLQLEDSENKTASFSNHDASAHDERFNLTAEVESFRIRTNAAERLAATAKDTIDRCMNELTEEKKRHAETGLVLDTLRMETVRIRSSTSIVAASTSGGIGSSEIESQVQILRDSLSAAVADLQASQTLNKDLQAVVAAANKVASFVAYLHDRPREHAVYIVPCNGLYCSVIAYDLNRCGNNPCSGRHCAKLYIKIHSQSDWIYVMCLF